MTKAKLPGTKKIQVKPPAELLKDVEKVGKELADRFSEKFAEGVQRGVADKATRSAARSLVDAIADALSEKLSPKPPKPTTTDAVAPAFTALNDEGNSVSLANFAGKTVVLYFYPKDDTPGCTQQSCDFRDSFARLEKDGVLVLGISKDSVASHAKFRKKYGLPFSLIADEDTKITQAYGAWTLKKNYGREYHGTERTTLIVRVDAKGVGRIVKTYAKVKVAGHVDEVLKDLETLK